MRLDGADVLLLSQKDDFGCVAYTDNSLPPIDICQLAICKYQDSDEIYLFLLDENMEVQSDWDFDSIEAAMEAGKQKNGSVKWEACP